MGVRTMGGKGQSPYLAIKASKADTPSWSARNTTMSLQGIPGIASMCSSHQLAILSGLLDAVRGPEGYTGDKLYLLPIMFRAITGKTGKPASAVLSAASRLRLLHSIAIARRSN